MAEQQSDTIQFAAAYLSAQELAGTGWRDERAVTIATLLYEQLQMQFAACDLAVIFATSHFTEDLAAIGATLQTSLRPRVLLACSAEGVVATDTETEREPAISMLAGRLPGVQLTPFRLNGRHLSEWATMLSDRQIFSEAIGAPNAPKLFVVLSDPFTAPIDAAGDLGVSVLQAFNDYFPNVPVVGGIASGGTQQGANMLLLNDVGDKRWPRRCRNFGRHRCQCRRVPGLPSHWPSVRRHQCAPEHDSEPRR